MDEHSEAAHEEEQKGFQVELLKSYLAFAVRAVKSRRRLAGLVLGIGLVLTIAVNQYFPRTFNCTTILMAASTPVLDGESGSNPLAGAHGMIMRRENLEQLVKQTDLIRKYRERRPPLLSFKDSLSAVLSGPLSDKTMMAILVGTLEYKLGISTGNDGNLSISVDWTDGATAAEIAEAAKEAFLRMRHNVEISAFQEKMAILDAHATKLREEIDGLAETMSAAADAKTAQVTKSVAGKAAPAAGASGPVVARPRSLPAVAADPEAKEKLTALKAKLETAEAERKARVREESSKLNELKLRLTPSHPQVVTQEERLAIASQVPSELALLRAEVHDLEGQVKQRDALAKADVGGRPAPRAGAGSTATVAAEGLEPLSPEILKLLARDDSDPALAAQISGAVVRYGSLRDEVRAGKISLDTAQAAFNHRYKVVVPVEVPNKPSKPKAVVLIGVGLLLSLLLALALPILLQLKAGTLVEYWQVHQLQLPVLAELKLPPRSG